jgi:Response regulator containing CheY-like receiver and SARP domains
MRAVIIDDELPSINELRYMLEKYEAEVVGTFTDPDNSLEFILKEKPDAIFLDIDMPKTNGIELGIRIQEALPSVSIVFVTAYSQYALDSFRAYPLDYILKPIDEDRFFQTVKRILKNLELSQTEISPVKISCFGKFTVTRGEPLRFATKKSRELLAYLLLYTDRAVDKDDLIFSLFGSGDKKRNGSNLRVTLFRLRNTLSAAGISCDSLQIKEDYTIHADDGVCDYVDFCRFLDKNQIIDSDNILMADKIAGLYNGELLSDIDEVWAYEARQWSSVRMEELVIKTAAFYISVNDSRAAEGLLLRFMEAEPLSEQSLRLLMDIYFAAGDSINYRYTFTKYKKLMDELGLPISRQYTKMRDE